MADAEWVRQQAAVSLERLWPRLDTLLGEQADQQDRQVFEQRLRREWERLFGLLIALYGDNYDFFFHL
jgi:amylosucrase